MFETLFTPLRCLWSIQGRQDSVKEGVRWISPNLLNHGISTGVAACVLNGAESNIALLRDPERMAELMLAIKENRVEWKYPEETALPHLWCLMKRNDVLGAHQLTHLIVTMESELRIRFFPKLTATPTSPFDRYAPISDLTVGDLKEKMARRIVRVERYIKDLKTILDGFLRGRARYFYRKGAERPENAESAAEQGRLVSRIIDTKRTLGNLNTVINRLHNLPEGRGLCKEDVDAFSRLYPHSTRAFKRAMQVESLQDLDLGVERWASQVPKHTGLAGSPTLDAATELEQKLTDILFILSENVAKSYLIGTKHRRLTRTSYPWHIPASPDWSKQTETRLKIKEILTIFVTKFPGHPMPNPLVQAIDVLLMSTGDTEEITPLKTIAQDLFRWGNYRLSTRFNESAKKAIDLVMLRPDGSLSFYAQAHGITKEHIDRIRGPGPDLSATKDRLLSIAKMQYHHGRPVPLSNELASEFEELKATIWEAEQPVSSIARQLMPPESGNEITDTENHLNSIHTLTVPLLPAIQLGCITDPAAYVRGAWANIIATHGRSPGRRAAPMISNLHLGLSLIEDDDERMRIFVELVDDFGQI